MVFSFIIRFQILLPASLPEKLETLAAWLSITSWQQIVAADSGCPLEKANALQFSVVAITPYCLTPDPLPLLTIVMIFLGI